MSTKIVYFAVGSKLEKAQIHSDDTSDDIKEVFRGAAEAGPNDILKLYSQDGALLSLSARLPLNTAETAYRLEVIAINVLDTVISSQGGLDLKSLELRLEGLERRVMLDSSESVPALKDVKDKVANLTSKLEHVDHLSWLGLYKDLSRRASLTPMWDKQKPVRKTAEHNKSVYSKFISMSRVQVSREAREYLRRITFDNWQWDEAEMLVLLQQMYVDLGFLEKFDIQLSVLQQFLYEVYCKYNIVPFHNFKHGFMVTQMMYGLTWLIDLPKVLSDLDVLILLTSAICHDLDHPGYNNAYQINARTELALRYNDISPLENHHAACCFEILEKPGANIFKNLPPETFKLIREGIIKNILATDMGRHSDLLKRFTAISDSFNPMDKEHKNLLAQAIMKMADISNEVRPTDVSDKWADCLLEEFFRQSDTEKLEGLPVAPFMDREKVSKPSSQVGFIKFVLLPLFELVAKVFPVIEPHVVKPVREALGYYQDMHEAVEKGGKRREAESKPNGPSKPSSSPTKSKTTS